MKKIIFVLICCLLLTACGQLQEVVQPAVVATQPVLTTQTTAPISTLPPIPTFTPYHTNTPLPTYTPYAPPTTTPNTQVQQPTAANVAPADPTAAPPAEPEDDTPVPPPAAEPPDDEEPLERDMNLSVASHCPDSHIVTFYGPVTEIFDVPANGYVSNQLPSGRYYYTIDNGAQYGPLDLYSTWWELEICPQN